MSKRGQFMVRRARRGCLWCVGIFVAGFLALNVVSLIQMWQARRLRQEKRSAIRQVYRMLMRTSGWKSSPDIVGQDSVGRGNMSWRLAMLAYYRVVPFPNLDEPWDSTFNMRYKDVGQDLFCHKGEYETYILAVTGDGTVFPENGGVAREDIDDDVIVLVEVADSGIEWMEPGDLVVDKVNGRVRMSHKPSAKDNMAFAVCFADGQVRFLRDDVPEDLLARFMRLDSAQTVDRDVDLAEFTAE